MSCLLALHRWEFGLCENGKGFMEEALARLSREAMREGRLIAGRLVACSEFAAGGVGDLDRRYGRGL